MLLRTPSSGNHGYLLSCTVVWVCVFWLPAVTSDLSTARETITGLQKGMWKKSHRAVQSCRGLLSLTGNQGEDHKRGYRKKSFPTWQPVASAIKTAGNFSNTSTHELEKNRNTTLTWQHKSYLKPTWQSQWSVTESLWVLLYVERLKVKGGIEMWNLQKVLDNLSYDGYM